MSVDGIGDGPRKPPIEASPENVKEDGEIIAAKEDGKANAEINIAAKEENKANEENAETEKLEKDNASTGNEKKEAEKNNGNVGNEKKEDDKINQNAGNVKNNKKAGNEKKEDEKNNQNAGNEKKEDEKNNGNVGNEKKKEDEKNNASVGNEKKEDKKDNENVGNEKKEDEKNNQKVGNEKNNGNIGNEKKENENNNGNVGNEKEEDEKNNASVGNEEEEDEKDNENAGNEKNNGNVGNEKKKEDEKIYASVGNEKKEDEKNNENVGNEKNNQNVGNEKKEDKKNNENVGNEKNNQNAGNEKEDEKNNEYVGNERKKDEKNNENAGNEKKEENVGNEKKEDEKNNENAGNQKEIKKGGCPSSPSSDGTKKEENTKEVEKGESCRSPFDAKEGESSSFSTAEVEEFPYGLSEHERKGLVELRSKLEHVISTNSLFKNDKKPEPHIESPTQDEAKDTTDKGEAKEGEEKPSEGAKMENIDKDIALFGVPLLPSKGEKATDVLLLKFLKARDFKANDAFEMLRNTLEWRKENNIDSIMEEDFGNEYDCVGYMHGLDLEGHPVCYNVYGDFADEEVYHKTFATEESRERFLRWRLQLMEKQISKLDFSPGGIASLVQINDLDNAPLPSRKDLRLATKRALGIFQDNYPEVISRNIFINVPLWYYAFSALISPFLTQATKSKFVYCRPSKVTETLLRYVSAGELPVVYGGLGRENDLDFSSQDFVSEVNIKAGETETIQIPASEVGKTLIWDLTIIGWDVNYKEEFVPTNEGSYTVIVKKAMKISSQDQSIRNSFKINNEPGNIVITIENGSSKKKRMFYRYKTKCT